MNYIPTHNPSVRRGAPPPEFLRCRWVIVREFSVSAWQIAHGYRDGKRVITLGWNPLMKHEGLEADFVNEIVMQAVVTARAREFAEHWS